MITCRVFDEDTNTHRNLQFAALPRLGESVLSPGAPTTSTVVKACHQLKGESEPASVQINVGRTLPPSS